MNPIDVAAGLLFRNGKLLLTQRHPEAHLGGLWEFPGGKRESGESFEQCLKRELLEELGIEVKVGKLVFSITHEYAEKTVRLQFYHCHSLRNDNEPQPLGCAALAWISQLELDSYSFPEADSALVRQLKSSNLWLG